VQTDRFEQHRTALRVHADRCAQPVASAEELAAKPPVSLFPLIFLFSGMFIVLLGPASIQMVRVLFPTLTGQ
jgi:hypothetical protein